MIEIGLLVLEKIFKDFFPNINTYGNDFPNCGPTQPPGTMICTNLNFHYIRKLLCKSELFWLCGSRSRRFLIDPTLFLHFCDYLPFEEDLALDLYNSKFRLPKGDLYQV
jgi:hypothetical protein